MRSTLLPALARAFKAFRAELRRESVEYHRGRLANREVSIRISRGWAWLCRSPLAFLPLVFSGLSISIAPIFLYEYGQGETPLGPVLPGMYICWAIIVIPVVFYMGIGIHVIESLKSSREEGRTGSA